MANLARLSGQPIPLTIGEKTYQIYPLTLAELGKLQAWVDAQYRDPVEIAEEHMEGRSMAQQKFLMSIALEQAAKPKPRIGSDEAGELLRSIRGTMEIIYLGIQKGDPDFTHEQAMAVLGDLTEMQLLKMFSATEVEKVIGDPKAETTEGQ